MKFTFDPDSPADQALAQELLSDIIDQFPDVVVTEIPYSPWIVAQAFRTVDWTPGIFAEAIMKLAGDAYVPPDNRKQLAPHRMRSFELFKLLAEHGFLRAIDSDDLAEVHSILDEDAKGIV